MRFNPNFLPLFSSMIILLGIWGCTMETNSGVASEHHLTKVKAQAYRVPIDSVLPPTRIQIKVQSIPQGKVQIPRSVLSKFNVLPAQNPKRITINLAALVKNEPGKGAFSKPGQSPALEQHTTVGIPEVVQAKDPSNKDQNPFSFSAFGKLQGLKHNVISCIIQDSKENLWFGSMGGGLCRYDGKYFTHYTENEGLSSNSITCILEDKKGNIWLGTDGAGIIKFDGHTFVQYDQEEGFDGNYISDIKLDNQNKLWIATTTNGVYQFDGKRFTHYGVKQGLGSDEVLSMIVDHKGQIWFGLLDAGISVFSNGQFIRFDKKAGLSYGDITALSEDKNGHIWVGTQSGALRYEDGVFFDFSNSAKVPIEDIIIEANGNVWFGTLRNGAIKYNGISFQSYTVSEGLNNNRVRCIFEDSSSNLWFGTDGGGLSKSQGNVFSHLTTEEGLSNNEIFSTIEDRKGQMWFGASGGGLVRFSGNQFYQYTEPSELNPDFVYAILEDRKGNLWFGTNGQGVIKFDGQSFIRIDDKYGLSSNIVLSILEDKKGNIWFGTRDGGVCKFDGQSLVQYQEAQGLGSNTVLSMLEDPQGNIWFGTFGGGLSKFDGRNFFHYRTENGLSHNDVTSILRDKKGKLWFGTLGGGLNRFDGQYFTHFTETEGLSNNAVLALLQDRKGNLWVGTRFGLSKMNHKSLNALNQTAPNTLPSSGTLFKNYSYEDGFLGIGCWRNSLFEARNGDIYIGANDRLTVYHPGGEKENPIKIQLSLLDISIYNERIPWAALEEHQDSTFYLGNGVKVSDFRFNGLSAWNLVPADLSLSYSNNNLSFRLVASTLQQPDKVKYQYKLEGMETTWTSLSTKNEVSYANLAPGTYTLRARAMNSMGLWSDELAYPFVIRPPWWRTGWMYTFYALMVLGILWWFRRQEKQRQRQQLQLERQKTEQEQKINEQLRRVDALKDQFLANTSHELRTPLQGIIGLSESLLERVKDEDQKEDLNMVISSSRRLNSLVNDILDFSKIKNQEIELAPIPLNLYALTDVVLRTLAPLVQGKNLQLINAIPKDLPAALADENRVQQILYNLVGNAIKFTEKGHIKIFAKVPPNKPDELTISVEDTGIGVPPDKQDAIFQAFEQGDGSMVRSFAGTGLGLSVSKKLVELHGGQMWLESEVGQGSNFFFSLPLTTEHASKNIQYTADQKLRTLAQLSWSSQTVLTTESSNGLNREDLEKVHILVVDDEAVNQQVLKNYLNKDVYRLTQVMSGEEALSFLGLNDIPDLVLLDVMMPRMSGYEVCQKIREKYLPNELPVIMITAKNQVHDLILGLNTGANDYIAKPFSKDEFLARLNTHLNLHRINAATNRFVPNEFIRALGHESIMNVRLGDHVEQVVTVLFADIRDYTGLAETMTPEENFKFVSAYNQRIGPLIQKHQGFINQYLGDGIMAIFPGKPENALRASIDLQREMSQYNVQRQAKGRKAIEVGIGLHTGSLIMGIIGDQKRMDAATVSDTVNTASRMEGLTKFYGSRILLSEACLNLIQHPEEFNVRYLGRVQVKGKQASIGIFESFDADEPALFLSKKENLLHFEQGMRHYSQKSFEEAIKSFETIVALNPADAQSKLFLTKARDYASNGVAEDWIGVETMKEK